MSPETATGGDTNPDPQEAPKSSSPFVSLSRSPDFWLIIRYAALMGVVLAFGALAFLGLVKGGTKLWFDLPKDPDWMSGSLWWVAVTAGAGLLVGLLRHVFRLPLKLPGTVPEIKEARVEPTRVLKTVAVSLVSLVGGASLGPEAAMGTMGGGLGTWISESRRLSDEVRATNTLVGMAGAYGALLSTPYVAVLLLLEVGRPKSRQFSDTWVGGLLCASVAFAVFFPIAGSSFIGVYTLPSFTYEDWQLAAAVPLGLLAGALALVTVLAIGICTKLTAPLTKRPIIRPMIGGIAFGLVGVALPLTLFTGSSQLKTVISSGPALGAGLLIGVVLAKIVVFALCEATGFIGGPFFPMLFIGGTAGIALHLLIPGLPEALAFTTLFAALPGSLVAAPFTLILLAVLTTQIGTLQTAPVAVAVLVAYLAVSGSGTLMALASKGKPSGPAASTPKPQQT